MLVAHSSMKASLIEEREHVWCVVFFCFFFIAAVIHRTNDPTSTIETLTSMKNAIDYAPYLFTFNITSILS